MRALFFLLLALLGGVSVRAGTVVSDQVGAVSVTIYRDPSRGSGQMNAAWPRGYALISETRRIQIPAGESVVRFEGVAEGMLPETAIVTGLPEGVREKNRDARLLSPAGLIDAYLRRSVHLRRTNRKTGKVTEQDAVIRAGPQGGVILQTAEGFEALGCSGLPERMLYDKVPEDLSAKPTLSVITTSPRAVDATVTLSYLAEGFDWSANYVARMAEDGRTASLFAWLTIANGGAQSFADARLQVVAGQPNKVAPAQLPSSNPGGLALQCWPMDVTSTYPRWGLYVPPPPPAPPSAPMAGCEECDEIVVTGSRIRRDYVANSPVAVVAVQEDLGDLKLYRVPIPVTVAAQGQKQIAMIDKPEAKFDRVYVGSVDEGDEDPAPMTLKLRTKNLKENGLGLPLPAGDLALFEPVEDESLLAANSDMADRAIGEKLEIEVGESPDVQWTLKKLGQGEERQRWRAEISNAREVPVRAEILIPYELARKPKGIERDEGGWVLKADVPANGRAVLNYEIKLR
ncbi:MAG: hypothetical protein J7494_10960 [Sphingobium sp.]|nr:hypothetical protein [Sphingobium sp.]